MGLVEPERRQHGVARQHLGHAAVLREEACQVVEDAPLDRPQALGIERAVGAGDLGQLDVHHAHEPAVDAALERRLGLGAAARRLGCARDGRVERGVVQQDRPLELAQLWAGLEPVRVAQQRAQVAVASERVRLAPRAVEREQALGL